MNILHDINPERIKPEKFMAVIEIGKNSKGKYELDKESGMLMLDRILFTATHYPANYGFVPLTLSEDDDPLDIFVYCSQDLVPMCLVECRPIGAIDMVDNDQIDTKLIAVPTGDPTYSSFKEITDMPPHLIEELMHFLRVYKDLENKTTKISKFYDSEYAKNAVKICMDRYKEHHKNNSK